MKFKSLSGKEISCEISQQRYPMRSRDNCRSISQFHLGQQLKSIYKTAPILEEFYIPESRLSLDFFIPSFRIAFEFQGDQHIKFNSFYHKDKNDFLKQQIRDNDKKTWCTLNEIRLIEVNDPNITEEDLRKLIYG